MSLHSVGEILEGLRGLACPHCGAGRDTHTVGLVWDSREQGWRCMICGCRVYEGEVQPRSGVEEQNSERLATSPAIHYKEGVIDKRERSLRHGFKASSGAVLTRCHEVCSYR